MEYGIWQANDIACRANFYVAPGAAWPYQLDWKEMGMLRVPLSRFLLHSLLIIVLIGGLLTATSGPLTLPVYADSGICAAPGNNGPGNQIGGVINTYYPGTATVGAGANTIALGTATGASTPIAAGDLLLVIQMQDAEIDASNTDAYGNGQAGNPASGATTLNNAGRYEYVVALNAVPLSGGTLQLRGAGTGNGLLTAYTNAAASSTQGQRRFQVVRVPQYSSATLDPANPLTAARWNGSTGGILAFDVAGNLNLNGATMTVDGLGFRGGGGRRLRGQAGGSNTDYRSLSTNSYHAAKGEGVAGTPRFVYNAANNTVLDTSPPAGSDGYPNGSSARGAPANAGGGGTDGAPLTNEHNSGGGGGGNAGNGGLGGYSWNSILAIGGFGGVFAPDPTRLALGGGGGSGTSDDGTSDPNTNTTGRNSSGAAGGGMVLVFAGSVSGTGTINANGANALNVANDGGGGGGGGGSVVFVADTPALTGLSINARGGNGGSSWLRQAPPAGVGEFDPGLNNPRHGPGGGGGGGLIYVSDSSISLNVSGGANGVSTTNRNAFGAQPGSNGLVQQITPNDLPTIVTGARCLPELTVVKVTSTPTVIQTPSGTTANYTIRVSNAQNRAAATQVAISDTLPSGFTFSSTTAITLTGGATRTAVSNPTAGSPTPAWGSFTIPGGAQVEIGFTVNIAASVPDGTYQNPATATYLDPTRETDSGTRDSRYDPRTSTGEDVRVITPVPSADLAIDKSHSGSFALGGNGEYTLRVSNNGPDAAQGPIVVTDTLPTGLSFVSASGSGWSCPPNGAAITVVVCQHAGPLAAGNSLPDIILTVLVGQAALNGVTNTATVTSPTGDPDTSNNTDNDFTQVTAPDVITTKRDVLVFDPNSNGKGDPNDIIEYTIVITNRGAAPALNMVFTDTPDANTTLITGTAAITPASAGTVLRGNGAGDTNIEVNIGTLNGNNTSVSITFQVRVNSPLPSTVTSVANQGVVSGSNFTTTPTDDPDTLTPGDPTVTPTNPPGNFVVLLSFTAQPQGRAVLVRWVTAVEYNTWGFHIYRSTDGSRANAVRVTEQLILARGRGQEGATYTWLDNAVVPGTTYTYWLQETEMNGTIHEYGPATIVYDTSTQHQIFMPFVLR